MRLRQNRYYVDFRRDKYDKEMTICNATQALYGTCCIKNHNVTKTNFAFS